MSKKSARKPISTTSKRSSPTPRTVVAKPVPAIAAAAAVATATPVKPVAPAVVAPVVVASAIAVPAIVVPTAATTAVVAPTTIAAPIPDRTPEINAQIDRLRDTAAENAVDAAERLATFGDTRAVAPLVDVLKNAENYHHVVARAAAAMALGKLGTAAGIEALTAGVHDSFAEVSSESILALVELKATAIVPTLTEIVRNASGYYLNVTRHAAIRALGKLGASSATTALNEVATNGYEDASIVAAAREALARF